MTDPTDQDKELENPAAKYADLNEEQLRSSLVARDKDVERVHVKSDKKIGELELTCEALGRTIAEQSETLENRAKVLEEAETAYHETLSERDQLTQQMDELLTVHERVKADAVAMIQNKGQDITPQQLADALDLYSLAVARISNTEAHPQIVVALVQMATHIRGLKTMEAVVKWLIGSQ